MQDIEDKTAWTQPLTFYQNVTALNRQELIAYLRNLKGLQPAALIRHQHGNYGIAFLLGENLSKTWQSGDLLIFWDNADQTDINPTDLVTIIHPLLPYTPK